MALDPILAATPAVQVHLAAALAALALGGWSLARTKGTPAHRAVGKGFMVALAIAATSAFWLRGRDGGFGPLHALAATSLLFLAYGWAQARRGRILAHRLTMLGLYFGALVVPGLFALSAHRVLGRAVFG